ncbi:hypothetical protein D9M69_676320 [compost metagenome]
MTFGGQHHILRCPGACAPFEPGFGLNRCIRNIRARLVYQPDGVLYHIVSYGHFPDQLLEINDLLSCQYFIYLHRMAGSGILNNLHFLRKSGVIKAHHKHEAVQLRFRKRVGAFLFNGVLCGEHKEGP